jgi:hypothetical protein
MLPDQALSSGFKCINHWLQALEHLHRDLEVLPICASLGAYDRRYTHSLPEDNVLCATRLPTWALAAITALLRRSSRAEALGARFPPRSIAAAMYINLAPLGID